MHLDVGIHRFVLENMKNIEKKLHFLAMWSEGTVSVCLSVCQSELKSDGDQLEVAFSNFLSVANTKHVHSIFFNCYHKGFK